MPVKIKTLRNKRGITQEELAGALGIATTQLGKYERGWEPLPIMVSRDLAVFFDTDVEAITGEKLEPTQWKECEHAVVESAEPYGGLFVTVAGEEFEYPISLTERQRILGALQELDGAHDRERAGLLLFEGMNNRWVLINMAHVRKISLCSDDERMTPHFAHPEVYLAVDQNEEPGMSFGPILLKALEEHYEAVGGREAAEAEVDQMLCVFADGSRETDLYLNDEWVGSSLFALELFAGDVSPGTFVLLESEGYHEAGFYNLDQIAVLEAPMDELRRQTAPE